MLDFGRAVCGNLAAASRREWLVTNGIGGYASGTMAGVLTRRYHGLLIASLHPPVERVLLVTKFDETASYAGRDYPLFANCWAGGRIEPDGFRYLERFHLEGTTPVWTYACADALLEKRVWMQRGANTTYVQYHLRRANAAIVLQGKVITNYRDHHANTHAPDWHSEVRAVSSGLQITALPGATPFYVLSDSARITGQAAWFRDYYLSVEAYRGLDALDDNLYAGTFSATLQPGDSVTLVLSTQSDSQLYGEAAYAERQSYEEQLVVRGRATAWPAPVRQLVLAADQFVVDRPLTGDPSGRSVIAGYPWFSDWGRDTMISLPGLTLSTGRPEMTAGVLRTYARIVDKGMLPNRFPDSGAAPEYNTVDATLWFFEAIRAYHAATDDDELVRDLFPVLEEILAWHRRGTRYHIHVDPEDGLLFAGETGVQLTWMDAKIGDWVVTPRTGKPVEVNALWYNALRSMVDFAGQLGQPQKLYEELADRAQAGFARFWNRDAGYCYDVIDGPGTNDGSLRPNQLLAVSLPYSPLAEEQQRKLVDACARQLLTSHGMRSLAPGDPAYIGHYGGDQGQRDAAYHRGTVWGWMIGPFVSAHLRVYQEPGLARTFLLPLLQHLSDHGLGSISEIFDGDAPFEPRGCIAQAWSVAELLRAWASVQGTEAA